MYKAVFLMLLLAAAAMAAGPMETGPMEKVIPPWQHLQEGQLPADHGQCTGTSNILKNADQDWTRLDPGGKGTVSPFDDPSSHNPPHLWGTDILVGEPSYHTSGRISVDNDDSTGDIYVCLLHKDATNADTAHIWRSTDGGVTWNSQVPVVGGPTQGDIVDAQILCGHGPGDTTWLYIVEATDSVGLRIRRTTPDGSVYHWTTIDTANNIVRVAMDRNTEDPEHLFVVWTEANGDIRAKASSDAGATWPTSNYVSSGRRDASFAAGGDGYGYIAYMDATDSSFYKIGRFTNDLVSPSWVFNDVDSNAADQRFREVAIAADRTTPGTSQTAIALATYRYTGNNNIGPRYSYTANGGNSWSASYWPVTNQNRSTWLAHFPRIRRSYDDNLFRAIVSLPETTASWDTIVYSYTTASDPTNWVARGTYNDNRNTGEVSHDLGRSSLTSGGFIVYRQYGSAKVWFDGYDFTGVESGRTPMQPNRMVTVFGGGANLELSKRVRVSAAVYDQCGRLVRQLFNGVMEPGRHHLDPGAVKGVAFLRVTVEGRTETAKLVQAR